MITLAVGISDQVDMHQVSYQSKSEIFSQRQ